MLKSVTLKEPLEDTLKEKTAKITDAGTKTMTI